jgi:hypothetical protein
VGKALASLLREILRVPRLHANVAVRASGFPESEKEYGRSTAIEILKVMLAFGCREELPSDRDAGLNQDTTFHKRESGSGVGR